MNSLATVVFCLSTVSASSAFQIPTGFRSFAARSNVNSVERRRHHRHHHLLVQSAAKSNKNQKGNGSSGPGMEDAFRQLDQLSSLDSSDASSLLSKPSEQEQKKKRDSAFAKAMEELDLKDLIDTPPSASAESEAALYKDMATELSVASSEDDLVADLKSDLDEDDVVTSTVDAKNEAFMSRAIEEALKEAKEQNEEVVEKESLLDNKEIMAEIEKIFDRANDQLLEGLEEIRSEQVRTYTKRDAATFSQDI